MAHYHYLLRISPFALRRFSTSASPVKSLTVVGSGLMGSGITQVAAQASILVNLVDQSDEILNKSVNSITGSVKRVAKKKYKDDAKAQSIMIDRILQNIKTSTNLEDAVAECDLVIEAVVENLTTKQRLFEQIEGAVSKSALLATNTSSLRLSDIGKRLKNKTVFGGLHFFNPVPVMKLCEVIRTSETSDDTFRRLEGFAKVVGKTTVACKDTPGFITNRLLVPYLAEAIRMADRGDASAEDIDTAMKLGCGYPMGPFELLDYVGLDTTKFILDGWHELYPEEKQFEPSDVLNRLVNEGKLGKKSGQGFYSYK